MKTKTIVTLIGSIGIASISALLIGNTSAQTKVAPGQLSNGVKMNEETRYFLKNTETPPSQGNKLVDKDGKNHSCHQLSVTKNSKGKFVTEWTCWSEN